MPRKFFQRYMPKPHKIHEHKMLSVFGSVLHEPNLWHLNRRSAAGAIGIGLFFAWWPVPFQMVLAAGMAIALRVNLPLSAATVWLSNPITMPPMFYFAYRFGALILNSPEADFTFEASWDWLMSLGSLWLPFITGCMVLAILSGLVGYIAISFTWRYSVYKKRYRRGGQYRM